MKKIAIVLFTVICFSQAWGMDTTSVDNGQNRKYFLSVGGTPFTSFIYHLDQGLSLNYLTFAFQFRRNLRSFDDAASLSLSLPVELSLGTALSNPSGASFPISLPLLVDFNIGMHSTYNNIDAYGFSISAGLMAKIIPSVGQELLATVGPAFKMELKVPQKRRNFSFYSLVGLGIEELAFNSFSTTIGVLYLINYGN